MSLESCKYTSLYEKVWNLVLTEQLFSTFVSQDLEKKETSNGTWRFNMNTWNSMWWSQEESLALTLGTWSSKTATPLQMTIRDKTDRLCMFMACDGRDSYIHVMYKFKFSDTNHNNTKSSLGRCSVSEKVQHERIRN